MKIKVNWKREAIQELQARYGMNENMAQIMFERAYRKALRLIRKGADTKDLNIAREVYASIFNRGMQLFVINFDGVTPVVEIAREFQNVENIEKAFLDERFKNMAKKYSQVAKWMNMYKRGKISYHDLLERIKKFKETNREYLKSGS